MASSLDLIRLYVVWAPEFTEGAEIAASIHRRFDTGEETAEFGGIRIPVFVRSAPFDVQMGSQPRVIDLHEAKHNFVLTLGTNAIAIAAKGDWKAWFDALAGGMQRRGSADAFFMAAFDEASLEVPQFAGRNALRLYEWLALPPDGHATTQLLLHITNWIGRHLKLQDALVANPGADPDTILIDPERVFLSHAKRDGAALAQAIRRRLDETNFGVRPFIDSRDLQTGSVFKGQLESEIKRSTLIAIHTDLYGTRPFCRWEMIVAKKACRPVYILHCVKEGESRVFPYGGNAPMKVLRSVDDQNIDAALLEVMGVVLRWMIWERRVSGIALSRGIAAPVLLPRKPELADIVLGEASIAATTVNRTYIYPDPILSDEERELIEAVIRGRSIRVVSLSELNIGA